MNKVAIVTGASSGIGRATALRLAEEGVALVLAARRLEMLEEVAEQCDLTGGATLVVRCDLSVREDAEHLIQAARGQFGGLYPVLINAAGVAEFGAFGDVPLENFEHQIELNFLAPVRLCHAAVPWMLDHGGQIINVLSIAATHVLPGCTAYGTSKAALHMFGKTLAADYRREGLRVTSLIPGAVDTALWEGKDFIPPRDQMIPPAAVADAIRDLVLMPLDRNVDELVLMPPNGIL